jgi:hypothetical protein
VAGSPTCSSCGRRALRHRKRTDEYVCRKCGAVLAGAGVRADAAADVQIRRLKPASRKRRAAGRLPSASVARFQAVGDALQDMDAACKQLDDAVAGVCRRHDPLGCLSGVLAGITGLVVAGVTMRSLRWYFVVSWSLSGAVLTWIVLHAFSVVSWMRSHPLLYEMWKVRHRSGDDDADLDPMALSEAIVIHYLAPDESAPLVARVEAARHRTEVVLGINEGEP